MEVDDSAESGKPAKTDFEEEAAVLCPRNDVILALIRIRFCLVKQETVECPTKCISTVTTLPVNAKILYIDFEGRSDGESMKKLIGDMKPKRTIVVRGSGESCKHLYNLCLSSGKISF